MTLGLSLSSTSEPKYTAYQETKKFYTDPNVCGSVEESKNKLNGNITLTCNDTKFSSLANKEVSVFNKDGNLIKQKVSYNDGTGTVTKYDADGNPISIENVGKSKY